MKRYCVPEQHVWSLRLNWCELFVRQALPVLYPCLRAVISTLTFTQLVSILQDFTTALPDSKDSRLTLACQNKVGTSYFLKFQQEFSLNALYSLCVRKTKLFV